MTYRHTSFDVGCGGGNEGMIAPVLNVICFSARRAWELSEVTTAATGGAAAPDYS